MSLSGARAFDPGKGAGKVEDNGAEQGAPSAARARQEAERAHARARAAQRAAENATGEHLTIKTTAGWVRGRMEEDIADGVNVRSWRGIPFGADTSGAGRFSAPRPAPAWDGVRYCNEFGPVAPQPTYSWTDRVIGSEDCLSLDIVRPDSDDKLPVVVYLHGGSFIVGSSHMLMLRGFQLAATMDVVYVSVNFRLGALGYLDLRSLSSDCVANPAVLDQLLALQWVQENIAYFGGDRENITLMGESAGGAAVLTLMASPRARGLFHRAIAQSPPIGTIHSRTQSTLWARELVNRLALPRMTTVGDLRGQSFADIVRAGQSMMWRAGELLHLNSCYAPTVDGEIIPRHPMDAFARGEQMKVPLLIGTNADEASFSKFMFQREQSRTQAALRLLRPFDTESAQVVVDAYNGAVAREDFAHLLADALFWAPAVAIAEAHAGVADTWMYRYDFAPQALRWLGLGAMHSMELSNVFGDPQASRVSFLTRLGANDDMDELTRVMQEHWAAFIHNSQPLESWPSYRVGAGGQMRKTMVFDTRTRVEVDPQARRRQAWERFEMLEWGVGRPELMAELGFLTATLD